MGFEWAPFFFLIRAKKIEKKKDKTDSRFFASCCPRTLRNRQQTTGCEAGHGEGGLGACHPNSLPPDPHPSCSGGWAGLFLPPRSGRSPESRMLLLGRIHSEPALGLRLFSSPQKVSPNSILPANAPETQKASGLISHFSGGGDIWQWVPSERGLCSSPGSPG